MILHSDIAEIFLVEDYINLDDILICMETDYDESLNILNKTKHKYVTSGVIPLKLIIDSLKGVKLYSENQAEGDILGSVFDVTYDRRVWERYDGRKIDLCINKPEFIITIQSILENDLLKIRINRRTSYRNAKPTLEFEDGLFVITASEGSNITPVINNFLSDILMEVEIIDTREIEKFENSILSS